LHFVVYLFFEVFFSFIRKIALEKRSPLFPDNKHLHMLLYKILVKKNNNKFPTKKEDLRKEYKVLRNRINEEKRQGKKAHNALQFEKKGLIFSALSPDGMLPEIIELQNHPWFIGVQFHPEFRSRPFTPHPLFSSFVKAAEINKGRH